MLWKRWLLRACPESIPEWLLSTDCVEKGWLDFGFAGSTMLLVDGSVAPFQAVEANGDAIGISLATLRKF